MCARIDSLGSQISEIRWFLSSGGVVFASGAGRSVATLPFGRCQSVGVVAYAVAFVATLPALLVAVYASADVAIAPYLTHAWLRAPAGSVMLMGHTPVLYGLLDPAASPRFGDYRGSSELAPSVLSTVASLLVGRAVARAIDRTAGFLVSAVLICRAVFYCSCNSRGASMRWRTSTSCCSASLSSGSHPTPHAPIRSVSGQSRCR